MNMFSFDSIMNNPQKYNDTIEYFKNIYISTAPQLIFYASHFVDRLMAQDIVQDIFLKIWQKQIFLILKEEGIKIYLYRSVKYACIDYLKHQEVKGNYENEAISRLKLKELYYTDDPLSLYTQDERLDLVYKKIEELPLKCKEIFLMSYQEGRKSAEIAILLNISKRTVEAQLYKALKMLREMVSVSKKTE